MPRCRECGLVIRGSWATSDEYRESGLCGTCLNGPLPTPRPQFEAFKARVLESPEARAAYERARRRGRLLRAMRDHDANAELHHLHEGRRVIVGWQWTWLDWLFGASVHMDTTDNPGAWVYFGPLTVGFYVARSAGEPR